VKEIFSNLFAFIPPPAGDKGGGKIPGCSLATQTFEYHPRFREPVYKGASCDDTISEGKRTKRNIQGEAGEAILSS